MAKSLIGFLNVIMAGLVAGIILGILLGYNPISLSAQAYIEQQQNAIRSLNTLMPVLGGITILLTLVSAYLRKSDKRILMILIVAAVFLVISGLVTRFGNQPINALVINWKPEAPPADWIELRDQWWSFHIIRTLTALFGFILIVWASIWKN